MKGSVSKYAVKGSSRPRWRYRLHLKDEQGGNLWEGKSGFEKQSDADEALRLHIASLEKRSAAPTSPGPVWTVHSWLEHWLAHYGPTRCQPKTLERYRQLAAYLDDTLGKIPLLTLRHTDLETALFALLKAPGERRKHLSVRTVRNIAGVLNVALNKAFRLELIPVNPMLRVEQPKYKRKDARSLTPEEMQALRKVCRGDWTFVLIELGLASGARRGELLALTWSDVDWLSRTVTINKSLEQTKAGLRLKGTKNDEMRICRLPQAAIVALQFLKEQQTEHRRLFGRDYKDQGLVFCKPNGDFLTPDLISQTIVDFERQASKTQAFIPAGIPTPQICCPRAFLFPRFQSAWGMQTPTLPLESMLMLSRPMTIEQQTPGTSSWMVLCNEPALR